ncbi:MAG: hypothetical protein IT348_18120 [Candidatus Eisenbacteria bacterium]|nr:hypothetical protein [Candidatus Eisenbacteria bacterium]
MSLEQVADGPKGRVLSFVRSNGRSPARDFLSGCDRKMRSKLDGSFGGLTSMGEKYYNEQRFKPLKDKGKGLWEFKEHDHRLYCLRKVSGGRVTAVLLNGWVKDKAGRSREEDREIARAQGYLKELLTEDGGRI